MPLRCGCFQKDAELYPCRYQAAGYEPFKHITIGLVMRCFEFYHDSIYDYTKFEGPKGESAMPPDRLLIWKKLVGTTPLVR